MEFFGSVGQYLDINHMRLGMNGVLILSNVTYM